MENHLPYKVTSLECVLFHYARAYLRNGSYVNGDIDLECMFESWVLFTEINIKLEFQIVQRYGGYRKVLWMDKCHSYNSLRFGMTGLCI